MREWEGKKEIDERVRYWGWNKQLREQGFASLRDREKKKGETKRMIGWDSVLEEMREWKWKEEID